MPERKVKLFHGFEEIEGEINNFLAAAPGAGKGKILHDIQMAVDPSDPGVRGEYRVLVVYSE